MSDKKPTKYIMVDGIMKKNPKYKVWEEKQKDKAEDGDAVAMDVVQAMLTARASFGSVVPLVAVDVDVDTSEAIPIVCSIEEHKQMNDEIDEADVPLAESVEALMEMLHDEEFTGTITPGGGDDLVDKLCSVLTKYEIPIGMTNKLMMLSEYNSLEFIVDDSTSMWECTEVRDPVTKEYMQRWKEACHRLKEMMEIITYVPFNQIDITFLNKSDHLTLTRDGHNTPEDFLKSACKDIDNLFHVKPKGNTPVLEKLRESLERGQGKNVARYLLCDGKPNGGGEAISEITQLLKKRPEPESNPITFLSCTSDDAAVEWMKDAEEIIPYCSELDDFAAEAKEVYKDQGEAIPFTKGFYLICQLVGAMNPHDLDAMDESIPFTKYTLDNLLGVTLTDPTYKHYFDGFVKAQETRVYDSGSSKMDKIRKDAVWVYDQFLKADGSGAKVIPEVGQFQERLSAAKYFN